MRNTPYPTLVLAALLTVTGFAACSGEEAPQVDTDSALTVISAEARLTSVPQEYRYSGTVQGAQIVHLSTKITGRIQSLSVAEGDRVSRGQVLARVDSGNLDAQREQVQAGIREMEAELESARIHVARISSLFETDSATKKELEDARTRLESASARMAGLEGGIKEIEDALEYTVLASPFDGFLVEKQAEAGDLATPGRTLLVVEDIRNLEVVADVPESGIHRFVLGDTLSVEIGPPGTDLLQARVIQINPSGQSVSRQFSVKLALEPAAAEKGVMSGMYAGLLLRSGNRDAIVVPTSALVTRGQLTGLFAIDGNRRAILRWIRTGKQFDNRVEVTSGLAIGDVYVASHEGRLEDMQPVRFN